MLKRLFLYCKGYVVFELQKEEKERFLNLCKARGLEIYRIVPLDDSFYCIMTIREYKELLPVVRKTKCYPKLKAKRGICFFLKKLGKRKGFLNGILLAVFLIFQLTGRIWDMRVSGGFVHTKEQIVRVLNREMHVYGGIGRNRVDCGQIEKKLRELYPEIGWVSVEKRGCNLYINLNESVMPKSAQNTQEVYDIVAEKAGVVRRLEVLSGTARVSVGDTVKEGDVLISGVVKVVGDYEEEIAMKKVGAQGRVMIETDFTYSALHSRYYEKNTPTDRKTGWELFVGEKKLFSYIPRYSTAKYDIIITDIVPCVFYNFEAPIYLKKYEISEYISESVKYSSEEAEALAYSNWEAFLSDWENQGITILHTDFSVQMGEQLCKAEGSGTVLGNFISYEEVKVEENKGNEYSGNNP